MENKVYFGGVPTDIELKILTEAFPEKELTKGREISHDEIEKLTDLEYKSNRYRTVTNRWRREVERTCGIIIGANPPSGFKVLNEFEKVDLSSSKLRTAGKMARRSRIVAARVKVSELTEDQRKQLDHTVRVSTAVLQVSRLKSTTALPEID